MKKKLIILFLVIFSLNAYCKLSLQVESPKVQLGQPFRLTLTIDDSQQTTAPNLTPLRQDFTIVGTERSMNYTLINGQAHSSSQWNVMLMPKRSGILTIPSFKVGQEQTSAIKVEVTTEAQPVNKLQNRNSLPMNRQQGVQLLTEITNKTPYVNQQVIYTIKLLNNHQLLDADYQAPQMNDGLLIPLGESRRYQTTMNGVPYVVEEQHYAVFPQKSGKVEITPPRFRALIFDTIPQKININAKPTILEVKAAPPSSEKNSWLPAKEVKLRDSYDQNNIVFKQGDTLIRTITVSAVGVAAQLMPPLNFAQDEQFSQYPEKPIEKTEFQQGNLVGTVTVKVTYLLNKSGKIVIPELKLPWFNTETGQDEVARLPEKKLEVQRVTEKATQTMTSLAKPEPSMNEEVKSNKEEPVQIINSDSNAIVAWSVAILFALGWLITLLIWWWLRRSNRRNQSANIQKKLRDACLNNYPEKTKDYLLQWASLEWPDIPILNLSDLSQLIGNQGFKNQLHRLSQTLYRPEPHQWQGQELWRCILAFRREKEVKINKKTNKLPPINP